MCTCTYTLTSRGCGGGHLCVTAVLVNWFIPIRQNAQNETHSAITVAIATVTNISLSVTTVQLLGRTGTDCRGGGVIITEHDIMVNETIY